MREVEVQAGGVKGANPPPLKGARELPSLFYVYVSL